MRPTARPRWAGVRAAGGFTLVELLVVLAVMGLVGAAVLPDLAALGRRDGRRVARELESAYRQARRLAATRGRAATVVLELRTGSYRTFLGPPAPEGVLADSGRLLGEGSEVRLEGAQGRWAVATFDPQGRARSGPVRIVEGDRSRTLLIDPWTSETLRRRR